MSIQSKEKAVVLSSPATPQDDLHGNQELDIIIGAIRIATPSPEFLQADFIHKIPTSEQIAYNEGFYLGNECFGQIDQLFKLTHFPVEGFVRYEL